MNLFFIKLFMIPILFSTNVFATSVSEDKTRTCLPHVQRNLQQNLDILIGEGDLEISDDGQIIKLSQEFLRSSPRFLSYPMIFFGQIQFCPTPEVFDLVISHLSKIGFDPIRMDRFLKKKLHQEEISDLPVLKYQIGESWDRKLLKPLLEQEPNPILEKLAKSYALAQYYELLMGKDHPTNRSGSVYFGSFKGYGVFSLPYHGLIQKNNPTKIKTATCNDFKFSSPAIKKKRIRSHKQILSLPNEDIVFCLVDLKDTDHNLIAAKINWDQDFQKPVELITLGIGSRFPNDGFGITVDFSHECRSLVPLKESQYYQPDNKIDPGNYRLAMGCDVSHGNSGDGVFEKQTGKYVGMVISTSRYTFPHLASRAMNGTLEKQKLYRETSQIIPIPFIKEAMEKLLESDDTPLEQKDFIHWIFSQS